MADEYKPVAPDIDSLLRYFDRDYLNPSAVSEKVATAIDALFCALTPLAPIEKNEEVKTIWIRFPRGELVDYGSYEDMLEWGEVSNREEFEERWREDYPEETVWYRLSVAEGYRKDGALFYRVVSLGNRIIVNADFESKQPGNMFTEDAVVELCRLALPMVEESMRMIRENRYNPTVERELPYRFRTGVILRSIFREHYPEPENEKDDGLPANVVCRFRELMKSGVNHEDKIPRLKHMTANDFFHACSLGYKACGYDVGDLSPSELYLKYADGRDEGLTGKGYGLNEGPGIDFNDPDAWDAWYFRKDRFGGHPWEVVRGGNSTHVDLYVSHDRNTLEWKVQTGRMTREEAETAPCGYYYRVAGKHRPFESVQFYVALSDSGLPVVLSDAEEILARFDLSDYVGIVPHHITPRYCEEMFPAEFGRVIDFMHVYSEDMEKFGDRIIWLPEEPAKLK